MINAEDVNRTCKSLYKMNIVCFLLGLFLFGTSIYYAVSNGMKYGYSFEVIQVVEGVQKVSTQYTLFNLGMSMMFAFLAITAFASFTWTFLFQRAYEEGKKIEKI